MTQVERIRRAIELEPNRYTRANMVAVLRDTLNRMECLQWEAEHGDQPNEER